MADKEGLSERVNVRLTRRQWDRFQGAAMALDIPISDLVRKGMDDLIDRMEGALPDGEEAK